MKIEILGMGCPKCKKLYENSLEALKKAGKQAYRGFSLNHLRGIATFNPFNYLTCKGFLFKVKS